MTSTDDLIACPRCDALYRVREPATGQRATCQRCHMVLIAPRRNAMFRILALSVTVLILMVAAVFLPFLSISVGGFSNRSSVLDAALAFSGGPMTLLALAVAALIVMIPLTRVGLVIYVLGPPALGYVPLRGAASAFRLAEALKPWSMAEIFVLGVAVALVKVSDLAQVHYGPAFWMFAVLVVILVFQDMLMCRWSIWKMLEERRAG